MSRKERLREVERDRGRERNERKDIRKKKEKLNLETANIDTIGTSIRHAMPRKTNEKKPNRWVCAVYTIQMKKTKK